MSAEKMQLRQSAQLITLLLTAEMILLCSKTGYAAETTATERDSAATSGEAAEEKAGFTRFFNQRTHLP